MATLATIEDLSSITLAQVNAAIRYKQRHKIDSCYPESGPLRRELYVKHMQFFAAGATFKERLFMAANRVGESVADLPYVGASYSVVIAYRRETTMQDLAHEKRGRGVAA